MLVVMKINAHLLYSCPYLTWMEQRINEPFIAFTGFRYSICLVLITCSGKAYMVKPSMFSPTTFHMITHRFGDDHFPIIHLILFLSLLLFKPKTFFSYPCYILVTSVMAPVIRLDLNGFQELLSHDDAIEDLKIQG
jgi:hypothetical protein